MYRLVRELDPNGHARRKERAQQHRGAVILPGPNDVWSLDAYCKLEFWGIQIYAAIDGYSRMVVWYYVGITGRTAVSVLAQYLDAIQTTGIMPRKLRTDRGAETPMVADAHYTVSSERERPEGAPPLAWSEVFNYGTSKENSMIERWWRQGSYGAILQWRDAFIEYKNQGNFNADWIADRIAFLAIYVPIIRHYLAEFVHTWNHHRIRKQPKRPYVNAGIPWLLYNHPERSGGVESGFPTPQNSPTLEALNQDLQGLDIDEYLPAETLRWCEDSLAAHGFPRKVDGAAVDADNNRIHKLAFFALRDHARAHVARGRLPELKESPKPYNARRWSADYRPSELVQRVFADANQELVVRGREDILHGTIFEDREGWQDETLGPDLFGDL